MRAAAALVLLSLLSLLRGRSCDAWGVTPVSALVAAKAEAEQSCGGDPGDTCRETSVEVERYDGSVDFLDRVAARQRPCKLIGLPALPEELGWAALSASPAKIPVYEAPAGSPLLYWSEAVIPPWLQLPRLAAAAARRRPNACLPAAAGRQRGRRGDAVSQPAAGPTAQGPVDRREHRRCARGRRGIVRAGKPSALGRQRTFLCCLTRLHPHPDY